MDRTLPAFQFRLRWALAIAGLVAMIALVVGCLRQAAGEATSSGGGSTSFEQAIELAVAKELGGLSAAEREVAAVYGIPAPLPRGSMVEALFAREADRLEVSEPSWLLVVDPRPYLRFAHDLKYVLVSRATGRYTSIQARWWPKVDGVERFRPDEAQGAIVWPPGGPAPVEVDDAGLAAWRVAPLRVVSTVSSGPQRRAVLIGAQDAKGTARDVEAMGEVLRAAGFGVASMSVPATGSHIRGIVETIRAAAAGLGPGDKLMVYFTGHGGDFLEGLKIGDDEWAFGGSLSSTREKDQPTLLGLLKSLPAGMVNLVIDACNSGRVKKYAEDTFGGDSPKVAIGTSSRAEEPSNGSDDGSAYTRRLTGCLRRELSRPEVTADGISLQEFEAAFRKCVGQLAGQAINVRKSGTLVYQQHPDGYFSQVGEATPSSTPSPTPTPAPSPSAGSTASPGPSPTPRLVSTLAGSSKGFADGPGDEARFDVPVQVGVSSLSVVFVADGLGHKIRRVEPDGRVSTLAGSTRGFQDGASSSAQFNAPRGLAVDDRGRVYVADAGNHRIRRIDPDGTVSTVAGSTKGYGDGPALEAMFDGPSGIAIDAAGAIFVTESGNHCVRKIQGGQVTTLGQALAGAPGTRYSYKSPAGIALGKGGEIYVADSGNNRVVRILGGTTVEVLAGDVATGSVDAAGAAARFNGPYGLALDPAGRLVVADWLNHQIRAIALPSLEVSTIAGTGEAGLQDGPASQAKFFLPQGLAIGPDGAVYVADSANHRIRRIAP